MQPEGVDHTRLSRLQVGTLLDERYEIVGIIGSGAMGTVVRVVDRALKNTHVVLKFLRAEFVADEKQFERFRNEALVMRELSHPNIVRVFDFGVLGEDLHYISMEYIEGKSLRAYLGETAGEGLEFDDALLILYEVAQGMAHAHSRNVVHRDLKPDNVLIDRFDEVKITDFGLAKSLMFNENLTAPGETVGTPHYMAPEQLKGLPLDPRCDIYSFGIMAFELVAGHKPFAEENYLKLATLHLDEPVPQIKTRNIPGWYNDFIAQCTAKDPAARFQSFPEIIEIIGGFLGNKRIREAAGRTQSFNRRRWYWQLRWSLRRLTANPLLNLTAACLLTGLLVLGLARLYPPLQSAITVGVLKAEKACGCRLSLAKSLVLGDAAHEVGYDPQLLYNAVREGRSSAAQLMLASGVAPTYFDSDGRSALHFAIEQGSIGLVERLAASGPEALEQKDAAGKTVLMHAIATGNPEMVKPLLAAGASALHKDGSGNTCLILAAASGSLPIVELLLAHGAAVQINERGARGKTALQAAKSRHAAEIVRVLTDSGAAGR